MGKRARKTRWRALDIADEHSDSEESNTNSSAVSSRYSHSNSTGYYSKYPYSSQSTPARRRYNQYDGSAKSTRSSSTTSENKITFNEDEYTRITTPRQDVLFKKGYLNKPKSYQTQTSTGNSTISTGNSTENGTPDHQSTDLDYESQFVFPNGFVDQHGIYYVNSYEPYPLMLYNGPPTYYHEFSNSKSKRYSIGSLTESLSPNNEEAASQDLSQSGGEASNSGISDYSGGQPVYNMVYPGYYVNGGCTPTDLANSHQCPTEPVKKLKKRRERKSSKTIPGDSSEYTDENSADECYEDTPLHRVCIPEHHQQDAASRVEIPPTAKSDGNDVENAKICKSDETLKTASENSTNNHDQSHLNGCADKKTEPNQETLDSNRQAQLTPDSQKHSVLKPDAEEFVPRAYQPLGPHHHIKMIPPNFMPIPLVPIGDFGAQNFAPHPAFIPPGIPINFIPHHLGQKMFPPAQGFVSFTPPIVHEAKIEDKIDTNEDKNYYEERERESTATPSHTPVMDDNKLQTRSKTIDIAIVVSKLEAVKQQERQDTITTEGITLKPALNESKPFRGTPRLAKTQNFKRNYYNKYRNSPVRSGENSPQVQTGDSSPSLQDTPHHFRQSPVRKVDYIQHVQVSYEPHTRPNYRNSPIRHIEVPLTVRNVDVVQKHLPIVDEKVPNSNPANSGYSKQVRNSPERFQKRNWKTNGYQNGYQINHGSPKRVTNYQTKPLANGIENVYTNGHVNLNKNYPEPLRKASNSPYSSNEQKSEVTGSPVKAARPIGESKPEHIKSMSSSQWISVSSRKKKKNKNVDDLDANENYFNDSADNSLELFECYDVDQLVDVVPPTQLKVPKPEVEEKRIEQILTNLAQSEISEANRQITATNINIPEVSEIEKDIIVKTEVEIQSSIEFSKDKVSANPPAEELTVDPSAPKEEDSISELSLNGLNDSVTEEGFKPKKKSKKGTQKPLTKKIIITDVFSDLSINPVEIKTPIKNVVKTIEEIKPISEPQPPAIVEPKTLPVKDSTPETETEQPEKKSKKKKKNKSSKQICNGNSTAPDDSYNVPLENSIAEDSLEKTNDEISLELDKLIQKGMYSSLQEKIKLINVEPEADDFFKTVGAVVTPGKDNLTATLKAPDFNRIFQSNRQFLKPNMVSVEHDIKVDVDDIDDKDSKTCSSTADAANPSTGLVLDIAPDVQKTPVDPDAPVEEEIEDKKLYPITQAVKEWMNKTREVTPEVEILKSPSAIQREFAPSNSLEEEEVTLYSSEETLNHEQPDLLEYWENDLPSVVSKDCDFSKDIIVSDASSKLCDDGKRCDKCRTDSIKQDEEEIEVYESKYGQNEEFLHLQKEIRETQNHASCPGRSPYRAVCCSLQ